MAETRPYRVYNHPMILPMGWRVQGYADKQAKERSLGIKSIGKKRAASVREGRPRGIQINDQKTVPGLLRQNNSVDDMNDAVGADDVRLDNFGVVGHGRTVLEADSDLLPLDAL